MIRFLLFFVLATVLFGCSNPVDISKSVSVTDLSGTWQFKQASDSVWANAEVPGVVHLDLIKNNKIEDPFYRLNEHDLQWIDKVDWNYKKTFNLSETDLAKQHVELEFQGLDTYAKVYLNDSLILESDNMFRTYTIDVKGHLKLGENTLSVNLESPIKKGIEKYDALGFKIPVSDNDLANIGKVDGEKQVSIFTRKAGYHFGWDWGPRLVSSGIWKPVILKSWNHHKIDDLFIKQEISEEHANLNAVIELERISGTDEAIIEVFVNDSLVKTISKKVEIGNSKLDIPFEIRNPKLWWPNGMGEQPLYDIEVKVISDSYVDAKKTRIGLRTVELVMTPDSIGSSFYFKVNGHPVFMKGANYIPQDVFLPRVDTANYEHILNLAKEANMNMLRVWGGGIYENDEFYELCDEKGLLVWQDFMFACAMFPGDEVFLENVKQEAIDNVKRLRNHPSIALWCGNNEILSAWENWGWKKNVKEEQSEEVAEIIWKAYDDIFHNVLPTVVKELDSDRAYWPSSPGSAFGEKESFEKGDAHYWMVWWGKEPFDNYNKAIPRFMSEYGFQSFPNMSTINKYTLPEDHDIYSEVMKSHQRSSIGNGTIDEYMKRHFKDPKDFESFIYASQVLQAYGIQVGIEAHRRNRARCMGSLYWQINDCWPVASWSSIDYHGNWKALHYTVKKSFENFLISYEENENDISVYVVSDSLQNLDATLITVLMDFNGEELQTWVNDKTIVANSSKSYFKIEKEGGINNNSANETFLHTSLMQGNKVISENSMFLAPFKDLNLPNPNIIRVVEETKTEFIVTLKTDKFAKSIFLSTGSSLNFSDNYFDMLPNTKRQVRISKSGNQNIKEFEESLKIQSLVDSFNGF